MKQYYTASSQPTALGQPTVLGRPLASSRPLALGQPTVLGRPLASSRPLALEIVGSYRRGSLFSGDIDVIFTSPSSTDTFI
jgi:hypothetical protein